MPSLSHLLLNFLELRPHAVASGFPFHLELSAAACSADEGEAQKIEGLASSNSIPSVSIWPGLSTRSSAPRDSLPRRIRTASSSKRKRASKTRRQCRAPIQFRQSDAFFRRAASISRTQG